MSGPRRHHYVPRFLLQRFVDAAGSCNLFQLDKSSGRILRCNPTDACVIRDFYGLSDTERRDTPESLLAANEDAAAVVIRDMVARGAEPPGRDRSDLAAFLWLIHNRSPLIQGQTAAVADAMANMTLETVLANPNLLRAAFEASGVELEEEDVGGRRVEALRMLRAGQLRSMLHDDFPIVTMFENLDRGASLVNQLGWCLLVTASGDEFVTSDTPFTMYDPDPGDGFRGIGLASSPFVQSAVPLDPSACLTMSLSFQRWNTREASAEEVNHINLRTYEWADRWVYASTQHALQEARRAAKMHREQCAQIAYRPPAVELHNIWEDGSPVMEPQRRQLPVSRRRRDPGGWKGHGG